MSAESETHICNIALTRLGHKTISDIDTDASTAGDLCRIHYPMSRDTLLRSHPWNFAIKRAALSVESSAAPNHEYAYAFPLPTDCLRVLRTNWEANGYTSQDTTSLFWPQSIHVPYRIEGRYLVTNETSASIEYIAKVTDTSQFDAMFTDVLAQRIAAEVSHRLTDNPNITRNAWQMYSQKLLDARTMDAHEGSARESLDTSEFIRARY